VNKKWKKIPLVVEIFLAIEIWSFNSSENESGFQNLSMSPCIHKLLQCGGICYFYLPICIPPWFTSTLKMEAAGFSRTYGTVYECTVPRPHSKLMLVFTSALTLGYEWTILNMLNKATLIAFWIASTQNVLWMLIHQDEKIVYCKYSHKHVTEC
jgi:hypothetical protein